MKKTLLLYLFLIYSTQLFSHPHVFIDVEMEFINREAVRIHWTFDSLESENKIFFFDDNEDGILSDREIENLYDEGFRNVREYNYFLTIESKNTQHVIEEIREFSASVDENNLLTVSFNINLPTWDKDIKLSHFDTSYFIEFSGIENTYVSTPENLFNAITKDLENPVYYDPQAGRTVVLDTSKPQKGWLKAYPTTVILSSEPIIESSPNTTNSLKEQLRILQGKLYKTLSSTLISFKKSPQSSTILTILLISLLYGIIHGFGPGHRKIVISSYILTQKRLTYLKAITVSLTSALIHSGSGVTIILILNLIYTKISPGSVNSITGTLGITSYYSILILTVILILLKLYRTFNKREKNENKGVGLTLIYLSSLVPCPGAITIMLYATSVGMIGLGIITVLMMSLGIGLTLIIIAVTTLKGKNMISLKRSGKVFEWTGLIILLIFSIFMITVSGQGYVAG